MTRNFGASELKLQCSTGKNLSRSKERIAPVRICGFHISLLVNVSKIDRWRYIGVRLLGLVQWPVRLEIQKLYLLLRDKLQGRPYTGPDFRSRV
ncbi:unnamed protein product [Linum trigynum]|uniref:Uncharacterized protein n=1 Tax=Linum trigynum TaxID=586398 RepID=A0AAV2DLY3_9ROSI